LTPVFLISLTWSEEGNDEEVTEGTITEEVTEPGFSTVSEAIRGEAIRNDYGDYTVFFESKGNTEQVNATLLATIFTSL
jgi:hypothetical protein